MAVVILRPTGDGTYQEFTPSPVGSQYDKINESVADDDATYIEALYHQVKTSTFSKDNILSGLPLKVSVKGRGECPGDANIYSCVCLLIEGTRYQLVAAVGSSYAEFYNWWSYNPKTNKAWTLDDVNNLQFGVYQTASGKGFRVTQLWLEVELADNALTIDDGGTTQQEAVGLGGVDDPNRGESVELSASMSYTDAGSGVDNIPGNRVITLDDIAAAYESMPGDPNWDEDCDLNHNGIVDLGDLLILAGLGGELSLMRMYSINSVAENGSGMDVINTLQGTNSVTDYGNYAEMIDLQGIMVIVDSGSGVDNIPGNRVITLDDIAAAYESMPGDPNWDEDCDLNHNGIVDLGDLLILADLGGELSLMRIYSINSVAENGSGMDVINTLQGTNSVNEICTSNDYISLNVATAVSDSGHGNDDASENNATLLLTDSGSGVDSASTAEAFFLVDQNNVLQPLGVIVLRGESKEDLIPGTRDDTEKVPGRDGEVDFGCNFKLRNIELKVAQKTDPVVREQLKRAITRWLNPKAGAKPLIFADDPEKTYYVRYAGKIDLSQWVNYMEFTIPFKASDPIIYGTFEKLHIGSGTLTSAGNYETPLAITVAGPATDPQVTIGSAILSYAGALAEGDVLFIDTGAMTVKLNGINALANYSGGFPKLQPGDTLAMAASAGTTTFTWRDRWI